MYLDIKNVIFFVLYVLTYNILFARSKIRELSTSNLIRINHIMQALALFPYISIFNNQISYID
jgi:hypothetical protein